MSQKTTTTNENASAATTAQNTYQQARAILRICPDIDIRRAERNRKTWRDDDLYAAAWDEGGSSDREALAEAGLAPNCECSACSCTDPATCTDDGGNRVCTTCEEYTTDADGNVLCGNCEGVETVVESCGAGNQTRSYLRQSPPEMPDEDEDGEYALYWVTVGDDAHVVSRHTTREYAEQAVAAKDWPRPGDNTHYLCGYEVRQLVDGSWINPED